MRKHLSKKQLGKLRQAALFESLEERQLLSAATQTTLSLSTNKSICGADVTFTATVSPTTANGTPLTGTVKFFEGSTPLETAPVDSNGEAVINLDNLYIGKDSITAKYKGNSTFTNSTSAAQTLKIKLGTTSAGVDSGLTISNADAGTGTATAAAGDYVEVEYTGYLDDGTQFQGGNALETGGVPFDFQLVAPETQGSAIEGFNDGIIGMTIGQTRLVQMRSGLGYGSVQQSNSYTGAVTIPANSRLNFIMTLLAFQSSQSVPDLYVNAGTSDSGTGFPVLSGASPSGETDTDFGAVFTGSSVTNTFTLATETTLNFTQDPEIVVTGSGASAFTVGSIQFAPSNTSGTFTVTFDPTTTGIFNAKVEVFSNDPNNPTYVIKVRGDGVADTASPAAETAGFVDIASNAGEMTFVDLNPGSAGTMLLVPSSQIL
ncbi:MAG TPA: Ig-like domain repeat protein [Tepidisphaeraceae bacterium]|nr:Ig-like domain repeat protein [Tepidisphaeraceae bacterium]